MEAGQERLDLARVFRSGNRAEKPDPRNLDRLLRLDSTRRSQAAKECDELPSPHSTTSSTDSRARLRALPVVRSEIVPRNTLFCVSAGTPAARIAFQESG